METLIITSDPNAKVQMKGGLPIAVGFGEVGISADGLGPLYEWVRDFIRSFKPAF
jgi:hypothetical protein